MGWKALKETLGTDHHIQVTSKGVCIGSGSIYELAVIDPDTGKVRENSTFKGALQSKCPKLLELWPEEIMRLLAKPDHFERSIPVYTYRGGDIIEKQCEQPGWPNNTHDGDMMFENTYSTDKGQVVAWAKRNASAEIDYLEERVANLTRELAQVRERLDHTRAIRGQLEVDYPSHHSH